MGEEGRTSGGRGVIVRPRHARDDAAVRAVVAQAFGRKDEADLIDRLRADGVIACAFVAEFRNEITGAVVLSRLEAPFPALALAPLAVSPMWQEQGIGRTLVRAAIDAAGSDAVFVLGAAEYYERLGFSAERAAGYVCAYAGPSFLVHGPEDLPATGRILYPQAFSGV